MMEKERKRAGGRTGEGRSRGKILLPQQGGGKSEQAHDAGRLRAGEERPVILSLGYQKKTSKTPIKEFAKKKKTNQDIGKLGGKDDSRQAEKKKWLVVRKKK